MFGQQLHQPPVAVGVVVDTQPSQHLARLVDQRHVVSVFGPIDAAVHRKQHISSRSSGQAQSLCGPRSALIPGLKGPPSRQPFVPPANRRGLVYPSAQASAPRSMRDHPAAGSLHAQCITAGLAVMTDSQTRRDQAPHSSQRPLGHDWRSGCRPVPLRTN